MLSQFGDGGKRLVKEITKAVVPELCVANTLLHLVAHPETILLSRRLPMSVSTPLTRDSATIADKVPRFEGSHTTSRKSG